MITRETLHCLVDELPPTALAQAEYVLQLVRDLTKQPSAPIADDDPLWLFLQSVPVDDEPLTEEDIAAIEEAKAEFAQVGGIPWEFIELRRQMLD